MLTKTQTTPGYEVQISANLMLINFSDSSDHWSVSDLVIEVQQQLRRVTDLELVLNLEDVTIVDGRILKAVWQLSRTMRMYGLTAKCVMPEANLTPSLEIFAVNGLVDLYESVDSIISEENSCDTWQHGVEFETLAW